MSVPAGVRALALFSAFGAIASCFAAITLLSPGTALDSVWRVNPAGHAGLLRLGGWAVLLMGSVSVACSCAAFGLWNGREWARILAVVILLLNSSGDLLAAILRHQLVTLIGVPIGGAVIAYLLSDRVRRSLDPPPSS